MARVFFEGQLLGQYIIKSVFLGKLFKNIMEFQKDLYSNRRPLDGLLLTKYPSFIDGKIFKTLNYKKTFYTFRLVEEFLKGPRLNHKFPNEFFSQKGLLFEKVLLMFP